MDFSALSYTFFIHCDEALVNEVEDVLHGEFMITMRSEGGSDEISLIFNGYLPDAARALSEYLQESDGSRSLGAGTHHKVLKLPYDFSPAAISELISETITEYSGIVVISAP